jgi:lathosterol oxidase
MHPIEHGIYFSVFVLFWFVPVHPVLVILLGFFQGISPAISHSGFEEVRLGRHLKIAAGDPFHQIHHKYYEVNYGNKPAPFDKLFGSWHDGTVEAKRAFRMQRAQTLKG